MKWLEKSKLILFIVVLVLSNCSLLGGHPSYNTVFKKSELTPLPINFDLPKQKSFNDTEKSYILGRYSDIIKAGFNSYWPLQNQYIYFKSLWNLKHYGSLFTLLKANEQIYHDTFLGPVFVHLAMKVSLKTKHPEEAVYLFKNYGENLTTLPENIVEPVLSELAAFKETPSWTPSEGGYYFYRYRITKDLQDLKKSVELKYPKAITELSIHNYDQFFKDDSLKDALPLFQKYNVGVYLKVLESLGEQEKVSSYYFFKHEYKLSLKYAPPKSYLHYNSLLNLDRASDSDIAAAKENISKSFYSLGKHYYEKDDFEGLASIITKGFHSEVLRFYLVLGLNKVKYHELLHTLEFLETSEFAKDFSAVDKGYVLYWLGYLNQRVGSQEKAIEYFKKLSSECPFTYYGWEALSALDNQNRLEVMNNWKENAKKAIDLNEDYLEKVNKAKLDTNDLTLRRSFFFLSLREDQTSITYLKHFFKQKSPDENLRPYYSLLLAREAYAVHHMGYYFYYIRHFQRTIDKNSQFSIFYKNILPYLLPFKYDDLIKKAAKKYGFKPSMFAGLVLQESNYDIFANSWVGAKGLSQLMDYTAAPILKSLTKKKLISDTDVFNPATNIMVGSTYFNSLYNRVFKKYPDEYRLALAYASYNAGPTRIRRYYKELENHENLSHFIESIKIKESRNYVKYLLLYKGLYEFVYDLR